MIIGCVCGRGCEGKGDGLQIFITDDQGPKIFKNKADWNNLSKIDRMSLLDSDCAKKSRRKDPHVYKAGLFKKFSPRA